MKFRFLPRVIIPAALFAIAFGCSKSDSSSTPPKSKLQLMTQASWKWDTAGLGADASGKIVSPIPDGVIDPCDKDNIITLRSNGTGTEDQGALKCNVSDPQTQDFTWTFNSDSTQLSSSDSLFTGFSGSITITSLTETQLHLQKTVTYLSTPFIVNLYLKH